MVSEDLIDGGEEGIGVGVAAHGHILVLDVPPERLDGTVEFGRVGGQVEDVDTGGLQGREHLLDDGAAMDGIVVHDDDAGAGAAVASGRGGGSGGQPGHVAPKELRESGAVDLTAPGLVGQTGSGSVRGKRANDVDTTALRGDVGHDGPCAGARPGVTGGRVGAKPLSSKKERSIAAAIACPIKESKTPGGRRPHPGGRGLAAGGAPSAGCVSSGSAPAAAARQAVRR